MRFKKFLEATRMHALKPAEMTFDQMLEWVEHNSLRYVHQNCPIYRGVISKTAEGLYNASTIERRAANTANYYNLWIDNHPAWSEFPKRSKSFVGSTFISKAEEYGELYVVIPQDGATIGVCSRNDIWDSFRSVRVITGGINGMGSGMDAFMKLTSAIADVSKLAGSRDRDWSLFEESLKKVTPKALSDDLPHWTKFMREFGDLTLNYMIDNHFSNAYEAYEKILDPKLNHFQVQKAATFSAPEFHEVWVSGGILMVKPETWKQILRELDV